MQQLNVDSCVQTLKIIITRWWEISHKSAQSCTGSFQMRLCTFFKTAGAWNSGFYVYSKSDFKQTREWDVLKICCMLMSVILYRIYRGMVSIWFGLCINKYAKCQAHTHLDHPANQNLIDDSEGFEPEYLCEYWVNIKQFNSIYQLKTSPGLIQSAMIIVRSF